MSVRSTYTACKGAMKIVPLVNSESGFYSRYFLVPKKDGGFRPILDFRRLNQARMRRPFRMLTLKQILAQIQPEDWFLSVDLKDAYFHIRIAPRHRPFLRFAFEGVAYQYTVLPLDCLWPTHFYEVRRCSSFPSETDGNLQTEPRSGYFVKEQCSSRGMESKSPDGSDDLVSFRQGRGRPLRLQRQPSLPNLFFKAAGCPRLAQHPSVCLPSDRPATPGYQANHGNKMLSPPRDPPSGGTKSGSQR